MAGLRGRELMKFTLTYSGPLPAASGGLMAATIALVLGFRSSSNLASAQGDGEPCEADRRPAEMPHVCVKRFSACDDEKNGSQNDESDQAAFEQERDRMKRVDGRKHARGPRQADKSQDSLRDEPDQPA
jgi:hypothetical protein